MAGGVDLGGFKGFGSVKIGWLGEAVGGENQSNTIRDSSLTA